MQPENPLTVNELKDAFFSLKTNESPGHGGISFNVKLFQIVEHTSIKYFQFILTSRSFP